MGAPKGVKQRHRRHGLVALRRALKGAIDPRSKLGIALAEIRAGLVADIGGPAAVSQAQALVIERAIRAKLRADAADAWLDTQPIESRLEPRVLAIEREARAQGEALVKFLCLLGLEKRQQVKSWEESIAEILAEPDSTEPPQGNGQDAPGSTASEQGGPDPHNDHPDAPADEDAPADYHHEEENSRP